MEAAGVVGLVLTVLMIFLIITIAVNVTVTKNLLSKLFFPEGLPLFLKVCPYCYRQMPAKASVCSFCQRESEPWAFRDGHWWRTAASGKTEYLDPATRMWIEQA